MAVRFSLTNRATPLISIRPYTLIERGKITAFLRKPHLKNLPPQIRTGAIDGMVFLCHAPDGQRIFLKTSYKREVIISIRYQDGNVYAELRSTRCSQKTFECFLVKEKNKIHHQGRTVDTASLLGTKKRYHRPKITLKTGPDKINKSEKIKRGRWIESWLKDMADTPKGHTAKASKHGAIQICSYNREPVLLHIGKRHKSKQARVSFAITGAFKQAFVRIGRKRWEFDLVCERGKCIVRLVSEPL